MALITSSILIGISTLRGPRSLQGRPSVVLYNNIVYFSTGAALPARERLLRVPSVSNGWGSRMPNIEESIIRNYGRLENRMRQGLRKYRPGALNSVQALVPVSTSEPTSYIDHNL